MSLTRTEPTGAAPEKAGPGADRPALLAFSRDAATEAALRDGFAEVLPPEAEFRRGGVREATAALQHATSPRVLVVDVAGEPQPLAALEDLAQVLEPDVRVLVVGDREDMDFYRRVTRSLGAQEYLFKPLQAEIVARLFAPALGGRLGDQGAVRGGRIIAVSGARGGCGASTLAVNLAWHLGQLERRHTLLLDADLHGGIAALLLGAKPGPALREALLNPGRIDELYIERAVQPVGTRLKLLAGEEAPTEPLAPAPGAAERLIGQLQRHYNFIVIDLPLRPQPLLRDLYDMAHQRVLVLDPSLPALRDALRLLALPASTAQARRPLLVLNRAGRPGGLTQPQVAEALRVEPDIVIPDLPRPLGLAEELGEPAVARCEPLRQGIARLATEAAGARRLPAARPGLLQRLGLRR